LLKVKHPATKIDDDFRDIILKNKLVSGFGVQQKAEINVVNNWGRR